MAAAASPPAEAVTERLTWWSQLFEPPCVGYAGGNDEIAPLAQAGADFIALGDWLWMQNEGPAAGRCGRRHACC